MDKRMAAACVLAILAAAGCDSPTDNGTVARRPDARIVVPDKPLQLTRLCQGNAHRYVPIETADPDVDPDHHDQMRDRLVAAVQVPNTTILLGPNVVLDFAKASDEDIPLSFAACVTLMSSTVFPPELSPDAAGAVAVAGPFEPISARTPRSLGPMLKFGPHRNDDEDVFIEVRCVPGFAPNDHVRISGFRLIGPSFGHQKVDDLGIHVVRCLDIEISNMEVAGWGGVGIHVVDDAEPEDGPGQEPPNNVAGERIGRPDQIRIFGNYVHHNQHPRTATDSHTAGYGVEIDHGAWGVVSENLFDFNRHAIAAAGDTGGYEALRNLTLKGGGLHYSGFFGTYHTHQFDIHGTGGSGKGGQASVRDLYELNAFQYRSDNAIYVRGRPLDRVDIRNNIFPHDGLEDDWGDDAIAIQDRDDIGETIFLGSNNAIEFDSYGQYGVCDFDGDQIDDLFLATGRSWWFSSMGEFPWTFLAERTERYHQVRLGYFDDDLLCDVLTESGREWVISSGGKAWWTSIGAFGAPLSEVVFGRFDPNVRDDVPGRTRRTTHALHRTSSGSWMVTPLTAPDWHEAQSSSFPLRKLRFADFTGDGVTDVLAVEGGRWAISEGAHTPWRRLNRDLADPVSTLLFADLNNDNTDDILKLTLERVQYAYGQFRDQRRWYVSRNGRSRWRELKKYEVTFSIHTSLVRGRIVPLAGRFGVAPGGGVLLIDQDRIGQFFSEAEIAAGASPDWQSLFWY